MSEALPSLQPAQSPASTSAPAPAASKWMQDDDDNSETDQIGLVPHNRGYKHILFKAQHFYRWATPNSEFGGNKLSAPGSLSEETEFTKGGKTRTVVKRKRKRLEDGMSDEEEDPYTLINIEDILSPIEMATDIVRRPALRRILLSPQIDALAKTSMEFIEGEKNFNKILCRLNAIMHQDDPRYLDLTFDRTPEQRRKYREDMEAAKAAANTLAVAAQAAAVQAQTGASQQPTANEVDDSSQLDSKMVEPLDPKELDKEVEAAIKREEDFDIGSRTAMDVDQEDDMKDIDVEAREVVKRVKELLLENINYSNEYISRLQQARSKLCKASMQKETLWKELKACAKEEDNRNKAGASTSRTGNAASTNNNNTANNAISSTSTSS
ncbi:hypothetical protein BDF20DRAFT_991586 [Mycotypha africana]|uniref:uncharacterized protein n=1 Tax=Mycotypha africana TaxID=64632 RepID=UPI002300EF9B|nr:uncharacterized protein BDF20DRAFT_991586 [Mycotypha africana]KAI8967956.1 hypothetical protein BDF20DRAFT_991586 [Mycotypha africana]